MSTRTPHSRDLFGVTALSAAHPAMRQLKRTHHATLHGNKSWSANYLLMDYLRQHPPEPGCQLLDVGCGFGLAGILCAKAFGAAVTAVDADESVFPFLQLHAAVNHVTIKTEQALFETISEPLLEASDWLIAADICFWDELADNVFELVERACNAGVEKIIIADPGRPPFWEMAEQCVEQFFAGIETRRIETPRATQGVVMVIENA